ncbi:hypothetical protein V8G54_023678 [Vigna mungo]|uniref:Uncharacterized protein n=1 Tax=Vigna mungo TaxID=3915 RepID=A0AAQ3N5H8_VIGMU
MEKIEIRIIGVIMAVMILSSFGAVKSTDKFLCYTLCKIKCAEEPIPEKDCLKKCESHCTLSDPVYTCITTCQKSVKNGLSGAGDIGNNLMNTCVEECKKRF